MSVALHTSGTNGYNKLLGTNVPFVRLGGPLSRPRVFVHNRFFVHTYIVLTSSPLFNSSSTSMASMNSHSPKEGQPDSPYRHLLEILSNITEARAGSKVYSIISTILEWLLWVNNCHLSHFYTSVKRIPVMAHKMAQIPHLFKAIPIISLAVLAGLISAVTLSWLWWYVRSHCIQIVYRILLCVHTLGSSSSTDLC